MFFSCVATGHLYDGGVMATASHLPYNRNGLKFFTKHGGTLPATCCQSTCPDVLDWQRTSGRVTCLLCVARASASLQHEWM